MTDRRADLIGGVVLLAAFYGLGWLIRSRPQTRIERLAGEAKHAGRTAKAGSGGLLRLALAEGELLERARRASTSTGA